ncbi:MAG: ATP-grasp domain-containing protein [Treponema sp.]|jgi:biotin carboxylase|nr:ATP-grasp domain-containing protein [Treponema sp.]
MKTGIIILGAGVMQGPAIRIAREMGLYTVVVDGDSRALNAAQADRFEQIDLKDKEGIEALARSLTTDACRLGGIMTAGTDFSASVAWAAERLGLPGIPYQAALNASDKQRMRSCFEKAGVPSPAFKVFGAAGQDAPLPALPVVVKPVDNMGGRGCRRVDSAGELDRALEDALRFSRSGRAIVESFMEGPEFSVDAVVYDDQISICGLADRHIFFPPYFIEMGHTMPTNFPPRDQEALLEVFKDAVRALGIASPGCRGAAKGDVKLTPRGPMIGEVAARLSGGYMSGWTYPYASGVQPIRAAIRAALGLRPGNLDPERDWTCAERAFISIPGRVRSISGVKEAEQTEYLRDLFLRAEPGKDAVFPENNVSKCGNVITSAPGREQAVQAADRAVRSILIRLEPANPATDAFLSAFAPQHGPAFPPDAFTLDPRLYAALAALPDPPFPPPGELASTVIIPFPEFDSGPDSPRDYAGRSLKETLDAVRELSGLPLPLGSSPGAPALGRAFWNALVRGGYQGAVYFIDNLRGPII